MRALRIAAFASAIAVAGVPAVLAQTHPTTMVWEKLVTPGLTYRQEVDLSLPRVIHALRYSPDSPAVSSRPELAGGVVWSEGDNGRTTLTRMVSTRGAVAGVNADFFPWTGDPLGAMVRYGELMSAPYPNRSVFAWGPGYSAVARPTLEASVSWEGGGPVRIHGINETCAENQVILNTPAAGSSVARAAAMHFLFDYEGTVPAQGEFEAVYRYVVPDSSKQPVAEGQIILTAYGNAANALIRMPRGATVKFKFELRGLDMQRGTHAIGGGPVLIRNGVKAVEWQQERFQTDFASRRHPRTAIGSDANGDIWLVVVDGRQTHSAGATLGELADIMLRLRCVNAINLDGGGSTSMVVHGTVINSPSEGRERTIANGILLFGSVPVEATASPGVIQGPARLKRGEAAAYRVIGPDGAPVDISRVIWVGSGAGWMDQAGRFYSVRTGTATIKAIVDGASTEVRVQVEE